MDTPVSDRDTSGADGKLERLRRNDDHIAPLTVFVEWLQCKRPKAFVPWFDPDEAGVRASILILLQDPGAAGARRSGFVSPDNDDQSAKIMRRLLQDAGVNRACEVVTWNAISWADDKPTDGDRCLRRRALRVLRSLLPELRVAVILGDKAIIEWQLAQVDPDLPVYTAPHPKNRNKPVEKRDAEITEALIKARSIAEA